MVRYMKDIKEKPRVEITYKNFQMVTLVKYKTWWRIVTSMQNNLY